MNKNLTTTKKEICFVIMPFHGWFNDYYDKIYCPAIRNAGLEPHRADDLYAPNNVVSDIWKYTQNAQIILADLTGKNPNVFYELGLAHAITKPAILITESEEDIPFDLRAIRIIKYDKNQHDWGKKLESSITKALKEVQKNPSASIPVQFLKAEKQNEHLSLTHTDKTLIEVKQELELLKKEFQSVPRRNFSHDDIIEPDRAEQLIRNYLDQGRSDDIIIRHVSRFGAPAKWIKNKIDEIRLEGK